MSMVHAYNVGRWLNWLSHLVPEAPYWSFAPEGIWPVPMATPQLSLWSHGMLMEKAGG